MSTTSESVLPDFSDRNRDSNRNQFSTVIEGILSDFNDRIGDSVFYFFSVGVFYKFCFKLNNTPFSEA